jgi:hypothetical protein
MIVVLMVLLGWNGCTYTQAFLQRPRSSSRTMASSTTTRDMARVQVSRPSSDVAAAQGIREWPQQTKGGSWREDSEDGELLTRYVLEGTGTVEIQQDGNARSFPLAPGTLVEVDGKAALSWTTSSPEMIILTPGFEQGGVFAAVAAVVLVLFGSLVALS